MIIWHRREMLVNYSKKKVESIKADENVHFCSCCCWIYKIYFYVHHPLCLWHYSRFSFVYVFFLHKKNNNFCKGGIRKSFAELVVSGMSRKYYEILKLRSCFYKINIFMKINDFIFWVMTRWLPLSSELIMLVVDSSLRWVLRKFLLPLAQCTTDFTEIDK